jgi:hypothetical protein
MQSILPAKFEPSVDAFTEHVAFLERKHGDFTVQMPFHDAVTIIAQVQLALRHPGNVGLSAKIARDAMEEWITCLDLASPGIGEQLRAGFDPQFDVQRKST